MRKSTVSFYLFMKYVEMSLLFLLTTLIVSSGVWTINKVKNLSSTDDFLTDEPELVIGVLLSIIMVTFNMMYNTLLINLRFYVKTKSKTIGLCFFDCINFIICYRVCKKSCHSRLVSCQSVINWASNIAVMGFTISKIQDTQR